MSNWPGIDVGAGGGQFGARRAERADAGQSDARMDQIRQEPLRRLLADALDRRPALLRRLRHRIRPGPRHRPR